MAGRFRCLLYAVAAVLLVACNSGTAMTPGPRATASPTPSATPSSSQRVTSNLVSGLQVAIPPVGGFTGTVTYTSAGAAFPAGATVTLQSFLVAPPGAPAPMAVHRRLADSDPTGVI